MKLTMQQQIKFLQYVPHFAIFTPNLQLAEHQVHDSLCCTDVLPFDLGWFHSQYLKINTATHECMHAFFSWGKHTENCTRSANQLPECMIDRQTTLFLTIMCLKCEMKLQQIFKIVKPHIPYFFYTFRAGPKSSWSFFYANT